MDLQELNDDRKIISSGMKLNSYLDKGFSEPARKEVTTSAIIGGIALALPLFGFDNIIYAIVLWRLYARLCSMAHKSFGSNITKSFIGAFTVNLIVSSAFEFVCSWIPVAGWIMAFLVGFFSIKVSGLAYLKALEFLHNGDVAEKYSIGRN